MNCPHCHKTNRPGLLLCEHCGRQLIDFSQYTQHRTQNLPTGASGQTSTLIRLAELDRPRTGHLRASSYVALELVDQNRKLRIKTHGHIVLGRGDSDAGWQPTVDLTPYGALENGVSRTHADLYFERDLVYLLELGSINGTRVNGTPVTTGNARQIFDGDLLQLGRLKIRIWFEDEP